MISPKLKQQLMSKKMKAPSSDIPPAPKVEGTTEIPAPPKDNPVMRSKGMRFGKLLKRLA